MRTDCRWSSSRSGSPSLQPWGRADDGIAAVCWPVSMGSTEHHTSLVALSFATNDAPLPDHLARPGTRFNRIFFSIA
jgi:hypothetical protein